jgi:NAD(P)-dependent dehydrogenase (short-subunit alcohol dehydrogenase family)
VSLSFNDKVAIVTGAASGIGLATAKAFADAGAAVALADVNDDALRSATQELVPSGHSAIAIHCNVADETEVAAMVDETVSAFGRLDAAFNNAGVQSLAVEVADASGKEFDRVNAINLRGVWNCMKYELRQMRAQGSGAIPRIEASRCHLPRPLPFTITPRLPRSAIVFDVSYGWDGTVCVCALACDGFCFSTIKARVASRYSRYSLL